MLLVNFLTFGRDSSAGSAGVPPAFKYKKRNKKRKNHTCSLHFEIGLYFYDFFQKTLHYIPLGKNHADSYDGDNCLLYLFI